MKRKEGDDVEDTDSWAGGRIIIEQGQRQRWWRDKQSVSDGGETVNEY